MITALILSAATAAAAPASADDGWLGWIGCWRAQGDASASMVCVIPADEGVRMINIVDGKIQSESRIVADGMARRVEREGCAGTETASWSKDQQRIFVTSDLSCGSKVRRKTTGIMSMVSQTQWLDVEAVQTGEQTLARTVRYIAAYAPGLPADIANAIEGNKMARETARYAATAPVDLNDVTEATKSVDTHAVTEWLTAMNQPFELSGKKLIALADQGVSSEVIDVLVAVSNPQMFAVRTRDDRADRTARPRGIDCYSRYYDPWSPYTYSSYNGYNYCPGTYGGYGGWWGGYYGGGWYPAGTTVVVVRDPEGGGNGNARVTRQGYTRGRSNGTASGTSTTSTSPSTTSTSTPRTESSGSGSSSSSGSSTPRTAHPRDH